MDIGDIMWGCFCGHDINMWEEINWPNKTAVRTTVHCIEVMLCDSKYVEIIQL